jgi:large subunit ribosomal protein L29
MKVKDKKKLMELSIDELSKKLGEERKKLVELRMQKEAGKLKDLHAYIKKRKEIATILTIMREKELTSK